MTLSNAIERYRIEQRLREYLITDVSKFPMSTHYAIMTFSTRSIHHEGDERSRTHPGHGYPEYTETIHETKYHAFPDKETWTQMVEALTKMSEVTFKAMEVKVARPKMTVTVDIDIEEST